jgi:hypothetical protein
VSLRPPRPAVNYAYVKFDALFKYLMNRSNLMHGHHDKEPPLIGLKKFQWRGTTASSSTTYYYT